MLDLAPNVKIMLEYSILFTPYFLVFSMVDLQYDMNHASIIRGSSSATRRPIIDGPATFQPHSLTLAVYSVDRAFRDCMRDLCGLKRPFISFLHTSGTEPKNRDPRSVDPPINGVSTRIAR